MVVCSKFFAACATGFLLTAAAAGAQVLTYVTGYQDGLDGTDGLLGTRFVAVSPDGANVYAAGESENALAVFARNPATGELTQVQVLRDGAAGVDGLMGASNLAVSPDGRHVYVGGTFEGAVSVFERDPATGQLTQVQVLREPTDVADGLSSVVWTGVSGDGRNLYTASAGDNAVVVFARDPATGLLSFQQIVRDGVGGVSLMTGTISGALSGDGRSLYVAARLDDAVVTFDRDPATGTLTLVQELKDGVGGVDGLDGARFPLVGKNGRQVYVASLVDHSVAVFDRHKATGALTFVQVVKDNAGVVDGLMGASTIAESHDGKYLFVGGFGEDEIAVFRRSPASGVLAFVEVKRNDGVDAEGLDGVLSLDVTPDGKHLYSGSFFQSAVVFFDVDRGN